MSIFMVPYEIGQPARGILMKRERCFARGWSILIKRLVNIFFASLKFVVSSCNFLWNWYNKSAKMRVMTAVTLATAIITALLLRCGEGASLRFSLPEDDEDLRLRPMYRDYGLIRSRQIRADDVFDDYGHLRFGRSDD